MRALDAIDDWRGAYEAANGKSAPDIYYQGGWFLIHYEHLAIKHRRKDLEAMTVRLRERAEREQRERKK